MKKVLYSIIFLALAFTSIDAQKLSRKCPASTQIAKVELAATGDINIVPCPSKTVNINGGIGGGGGGGNGQGLAGYTVTNTTTARTLNPNDSNYSLTTLSNVTGTIIQDLQTTGVLNATTPTLYELGTEDEIVTTGLRKTIRMPVAFNLLKLRASVKVASSSGVISIDIRQNGVSILGSNKLTIDASENSSATAATVVTISTAALTDDAEITFVVLSSGANATGLKVWMVGRYTAP